MRAAIFALIIFLVSFAPVQARYSADFQGSYKLNGVVVLSRHNIRAPISNKNSTLGKLTSHDWFEWTSAPGELSMRGGELETIMGQYFRKWLAKENLITENYLPTAGEVYFYANSMQRTIATAQFFSSGLFPVANVRVNHKFAPSKMDPVFNPQLTLVNDEFTALANEQVHALFDAKIPFDGYRLIERVLDFKNSTFAKTENITKFHDEPFEVIFELNKEPDTRGTLKLITLASDALILQYYEAKNPRAAAFGHKISFKDWQKIASVKDFYGDVLFTAPAVAVNVAHPLLKVMRDELASDRKFTFLCGHDSNISSVLAALEVEDYDLPQTIERQTPIGYKFVIEKWRGADGVDYAATELIYQSAEQLRKKTTLTLDNPPMIVPIHFKGLSQNADGLYRLDDLLARFQRAFDAYYELPQADRKAA